MDRNDVLMELSEKLAVIARRVALGWYNKDDHKKLQDIEHELFDIHWSSQEDT